MLTKVGYNKILSRLDKKHWRVIGNGAFGAVYKPPYPSRWVIKAGSKAHDGWPAYATMCKEEFQDNPYAPKVRKIWWNEAEGVYIAIIERLYLTVKELPPDRKEHSLTRMAANIVAGQRPSKDIPEQLKTLTQAIQQKLRVEKKYSYDCHNGNFMIDHDGRFVVTDPVGGR